MTTLTLTFGAIAGIVAIGIIVFVLGYMIYSKGKSAGRKNRR